MLKKGWCSLSDSDNSELEYLLIQICDFSLVLFNKTQHVPF